MVSKFFKNLIHILFDYKCTFKLENIQIIMLMLKHNFKGLTSNDSLLQNYK